MAKHNEIGVFGENQAVFYLETNGYQILERNFRFRKGEIDIIAYKNPFVCFVEVKTRSSNDWGKPEEAINSHKEKLLINTANAFLEQHEMDEMARFDVITIVGDEKKFEIKHLKDAIQPSFD